MKTILTALLLLQQLLSYSQNISPLRRLQFQSINQIGFVSGERNTEPIIQTINGVRYKTFFIGAGVGLDYYKERSIPLFLEIRKSILNKPMTPYLYVDGGYHATWEKEEPEEWISQGKKGGLYYDAGVGYAFPALKSSLFTVSFGYSSKKMTEKVNLYTWRSSWPQEDEFSTMRYHLRRYSFKMGLAL